MNQFGSTLAQLNLNPLSLQFHSIEIEQQYRIASYQRSLPTARLGLLVGLFIYSGNAMLGGTVLGDHAVVTWLVSLVVAPCLIGNFLLSYNEKFYDYYQLLFLLTTMLLGLVFVFGTLWYGEPGVLYLCASLIVFCMYGTTVFNLPLLTNISMVWTLCLIKYLAIVYLDLPDSLQSLASHVLFVSPMIISISLYKTEFLSRLAFYTSNEVIDNEKKIRDAERTRVALLEQTTSFLRHEMRNAVAGITSSLELLHQQVASPNQEAYIARAQRSTQVINQLLQSAGHATSLEAALLMETCHAVCFSELVNERVEAYQMIYPDRHVTYESDHVRISIIGREERLIQVLDNLISNAIDHQKEGTPIVVSLYRYEDLCHLSVANEGRALPEDKHSIFDLFASYRTDNKQAHNMGVGLYIAKLIVNQYDGTIQAHDLDHAPGAVFRLSFPITKPLDE